MAAPQTHKRRSGFSDLIDLAGPLLGMDLDTQIVTFAYEGRGCRLQTWDGTYAAGARRGRGAVAGSSRGPRGWEVKPGHVPNLTSRQ